MTPNALAQCLADHQPHAICLTCIISLRIANLPGRYDYVQFSGEDTEARMLKIDLDLLPKVNGWEADSITFPVSQSPMLDRTLRVKSQVPGVGHWVPQTFASCLQLPQAGFLSICSGQLPQGKMCPILFFPHLDPTHTLWIMPTPCPPSPDLGPASHPCWPNVTPSWNFLLTY